MQLLPARTGASSVTTSLAAPTAWQHRRCARLASLHHLAAAVLRHGRNAPFIALVALMAVSVSQSSPTRSDGRQPAVGAVAATFCWDLGQNLGQLYSGQATGTIQGR